MSKHLNIISCKTVHRMRDQRAITFVVASRAIGSPINPFTFVYRSPVPSTLALGKPECHATPWVRTNKRGQRVGLSSPAEKKALENTRISLISTPYFLLLIRARSFEKIVASWQVVLFWFLTEKQIIVGESPSKTK